MHLPVADQDLRLGDDLAQVAGDQLDVVHAVVHEVHLTAALHLAHDGFAHQVVVELGNVGLDGQPLLRRRLDRGHVADAGEGHVQCAGDGRGRQRQHVHLAPHLLEALLVRDAEALLLVDDDEAQVLERDVLLQQAVRPNDDVHAPRRQLAGDPALVFVAAEPREHLDAHGEAGQPLAEGVVVLLGQHRRRDEDGDLHAVDDGLEGGSHGDLGLAVAHVAADEPVHRPDSLHVVLHVADGRLLVGRLDVRERSRQLGLPRAVGGECVSLRHLAGGVELQQLLRKLLHGATHAGLRPRPLLRPQPGQRRPVLAGPDVAGHAVDLLDRDVQPVAVGVLQLQVLALGAVDATTHQARELCDAMLDVDDVAAGLEIGEERLARGAAAGRGAALLAEAEDLGVGEQGEACALLTNGPAVGERAVHDGEGAAPELRLCHRLGQASEDVVLLKQVCQPLRLRGDDHDLLAAPQRLRQLVGQHAQPPAVGRRRPEREPDRRLCVLGRERLLVADGPAREAEPPRQRLDGVAQFRPRRVRLRHAVRQLAAQLQLPPRFVRLLVVLLLQRGDVGRLVDDDGGLRRHVVKQRRCRQEGCVHVVARERLALEQRRHVAVGALALFVAQTLRLHTLREMPHAGRVDDQLARGADAHGVALL